MTDIITNINYKNRCNLLNKCNNYELNLYFKKMNKLADTKGGIYKKIYNEDLNYINTNTQFGGWFSFFKKPDYLNNINNISSNSYCNLITQKNKNNGIDNSCNGRIKELENIKNVLQKVSDGNNDFIEVQLIC